MIELEKKIRGKNIVTALICLIIGLLFFGIVCRDYIPFGKMQNIDNMKPSEIKEGRASLTVYYIYDYYCSWTDNIGREKKRSYFVSIGEGDDAAYIGCSLSGKKNDRAYKLMNELYNAEVGEDDELNFDNFDHFRVKGRLKKLSGDELRYYNEYIAEIAEVFELTDKEVQSYFKPYVLEAAQVGDGSTTDYLIAFVGVVLIIGAAVIMFNALFGDPIKGIRDYCNKKPDPDYQMALIERFYISTPENYDIRVNDDYFMFTGGSSVIFCEAKDVLWFYKVIEKTSVNFIPTGKNYYVRFRLANGKQVQISTKKNDVDSILRYFMNLLPDAIVGHDASLENMYTKNRQKMIAEVNRLHEERCGAFGRYDTSDSTNSKNDLFREEYTASDFAGNGYEDSSAEQRKDPMDLHLNFTREEDIVSDDK